MEMAALTCQEAYHVLLTSAKEFLGPQLVDKICHTLAHFFLFKTIEPRTGAQMYTRMQTSESFRPVNFVLTTSSSDKYPDATHFTVPGLPTDQLVSILADYSRLFVFEMETRGFLFKAYAEIYQISKM